jgi:hypothetical protein
MGREYVAILTGNGLKDTDAAIAGLPVPVEMDATMESIRAVLS